MDYVEGLDAARLLASRFPAGMPTDQVVRIVTAVASALDCAHKQGLLHRDVKPANIMLTHPSDDDEQRILLADFGIARNVGDISGLTATNMTVGTVAYAAPEQLMGEELDGRADEYALAATAYHLFTGSQIFPHSNPAVVISHHLNSPPPALADSRPELAALDPVLAVALAKDPGDRFPRCADFARALAERAAPGAVSDTATTTAAPASRKTPNAVPESPVRSTPVSGKRKRWLSAALALSVFVLAAAVALAWHPWQQRESASMTASRSQPPLAASSTAPPTSAAQPPPPQEGTSSAEPAGTQIVTAAAVDAAGQPANGYRETPAGSVPELAGCDQPSPAAVSADIYSCYPSAAAADVCWPSPPMSMLCVTNPWDKELRRLTYDTGLLPTVQPPATPEPFALTLDNGTHCQLITGGARRARNDGYVPFYACGADSTAAVLGDAGSETDPINRSNPLWTVTFEQPGFQTQVRSVTTAWFAGS